MHGTITMKIKLLFFLRPTRKLEADVFCRTGSRCGSRRMFLDEHRAAHSGLSEMPSMYKYEWRRGSPQTQSFSLAGSKHPLLLCAAGRLTCSTRCRSGFLDSPWQAADLQAQSPSIPRDVQALFVVAGHRTLYPKPLVE